MPAPAFGFNPPYDARHREQTIEPGYYFARGWPEYDAVPRLCMVADVRELPDPYYWDSQIEQLPARLLDEKPRPSIEQMRELVLWAGSTADSPERAAARERIRINEGEEVFRIVRGEIVRGEFCVWMPVRFEYRLVEDLTQRTGTHWRAQHQVDHDVMVRQGAVDDDRTLHWVPRIYDLQRYVLEQAATGASRYDVSEGVKLLAEDFALFCRSHYITELHGLLTPSEMWLTYTMWRLHHKLWDDREGQWAELKS